MDWQPSVACGLISAAFLWRWRSLGGRRPPLRFWLGVALQTPICTSAYYAFAESWVLAAWGLWLTLDGLAASCGRPALIEEESETAVWALVISTFGWAGIDALNLYFPVWTLLGFSFNPLAREVAVGLLGAPVIPTVLAAASLVAGKSVGSERPAGPVWRRVCGAALIGSGWWVSERIGATLAMLLIAAGAAALCSPRFFSQGAARLLSLAAGAATWAAFDALWSQIGPAERLFVGYNSSPARLPAVMAICAFCLVAVYNSAAEILDKPRFDPFYRKERGGCATLPADSSF